VKFYAAGQLDRVLTFASSFRKLETHLRGALPLATPAITIVCIIVIIAVQFVFAGKRASHRTERDQSVQLAVADWVIIAAYFAFNLAIGFYYRKKATGSVSDYFISGRNATWWLAGTSMVATTFAADTPLAVTGLTARNGIAGNWIWWSFLLSGMMTVFLFARLWRRSGLLTDVQFAEMRYSGKPAAFLRGFRALYLGLLMNCLILGWVTKAMTSIVATTLGVSDQKALGICVFFLIPFTGLYVALGGLWGVLWTDLFQFVLKMAIVISVAWYGVRAVGGMPQLLGALAAKQAALGARASDITALLPDFSRGLTGEALWTLPVITFVVHLAVQWWAFWYPGAEPGGGGYIAQRIFSAKDERNGLLSVLWFNLAHYALRPWPWILTALSAVVLYPNLTQPERGFMLVATRQTPHALLGILLAGFMAAFMSTVATQLNWGSSYLVEDFYRRFLKKDGDEAHYVNVSRLATAMLVVAAAAVAWELESVSEGWKIVLELGAGTGGVYLLRWYWWRVNAWSEISAMLAALVTTLTLHSKALWTAIAGRPQPFSGSDPVIFAKTTLCTTAITTLAWLVVTLMTPAETGDTLTKFYRKVRPQITGWKPVAKLGGDEPVTRDLGRNLLSWLLGCVLIYSALFSIGELCFGKYGAGAGFAVVAMVCGWMISKLMPRANEWQAF
jgi:Na+/proline symporter